MRGVLYFSSHYNVYHDDVLLHFIIKKLLIITSMNKHDSQEGKCYSDVSDVLML